MTFSLNEYWEVDVNESDIFFVAENQIHRIVAILGRSVWGIVRELSTVCTIIVGSLSSQRRIENKGCQIKAAFRHDRNAALSRSSERIAGSLESAG